MHTALRVPQERMGYGVTRDLRERAISRHLAAGVDIETVAVISTEGAEIGKGIDGGGERRAGSEGDDTQEEQRISAHVSPPCEEQRISSPVIRFSNAQYSMANNRTYARAIGQRTEGCGNGSKGAGAGQLWPNRIASWSSAQ